MCGYSLLKCLYVVLNYATKAKLIHSLNTESQNVSIVKHFFLKFFYGTLETLLDSDKVYFKVCVPVFEKQKKLSP